MRALPAFLRLINFRFDMRRGPITLAGCCMLSENLGFRGQTLQPGPRPRVRRIRMPSIYAQRS
jgi:hypothetical protein